MRNAGGYAIVTGPEGVVSESDTFTCVHCNCVVFVMPKAAAADCGGWCPRCAAPICGTCADAGRCEPFEKRLEKIEASARFRAALDRT